MTTVTVITPFANKPGGVPLQKRKTGEVSKTSSFPGSSPSLLQNGKLTRTPVAFKTVKRLSNRLYEKRQNDAAIHNYHNGKITDIKPMVLGEE